MMKSHTVPLYPTQEFNHPFVTIATTVYATAYQLLSSCLSDQINGGDVAVLELSNPYFTYSWPLNARVVMMAIWI